jgi:hypothetical protein
MKRNVKTLGRVRKLAGVVSNVIGTKITLCEHQDGKSYQLKIGETLWPLHTLSIREAGLALDLLISAIAAGAIKVGIMGFTLSAYEIQKQEAEKHFDTTLANIKTQVELMECLRSMLMELEKTTIVGGPSVSAAINRYEYVFTKNGTLVANAVRNIRFLIRAYKELSMPFMVKAYARQIAAWGRPR